MQSAAVTTETLSRLAGLQTEGHAVLSLYLDLDPSRAPHLSDRRSELDSLLGEALAAAQERGEEEVAHAIRRVRRSFADEQLAVDSAHGLAIFLCAPAKIFEVLALPCAVAPTARLGERPFIEPLVEQVSAERWCVLLISSRASRFFLGSREALAETVDVRDDVHRRHSQGGWSQARYQRGVEKEIADHIRQTCELLYEQWRHAPFDRMILGGPAELAGRVESDLHPDLRERLAGRFEIDVERASAEEVHRRALPIMEEQQSRREREAVDQLEAGLAPGGHAAAGLDETLALLSEQRVRKLLVAHGFTAPGWSCPSCGRLAVSDGSCPIEGAQPEHEEDVVERAIERALAESVEILILRTHRAELESHGSIGALLRY